MARRKKARATTALVVAEAPERNRLRALKAQLGQRRDEIAELDLEVETLRAELQTSCGGVQPISRPPARVRVAPRSHPATRSLALCAAR